MSVNTSLCNGGFCFWMVSVVVVQRMLLKHPPMGPAVTKVLALLGTFANAAACNSSIVAVADHDADETNLTLEPAAGRRLTDQQSSISIGFSISLTGRLRVGNWFKMQLDITNCIWTTKVKDAKFNIGTSTANYNLFYQDDQSDLLKVIQIYRFAAGLGFEYDLSQSDSFQLPIGLNPSESLRIPTRKVNVLWGPSNPQFAKVAVMIAKEAELPIIMWAQDAFAYDTAPGWKASLIEWDRPATTRVVQQECDNVPSPDMIKNNVSCENVDPTKHCNVSEWCRQSCYDAGVVRGNDVFHCGRPNANDTSTLSKISADGLITDSGECPQNITYLEDTLVDLKRSDRWKDPIVDVLIEAGNACNERKLPCVNGYHYVDENEIVNDITLNLRHLEFKSYRKKAPEGCIPVASLTECAMAAIQLSVQEEEWKTLDVIDWLYTSDTRSDSDSDPDFVSWLGYDSLDEVLNDLFPDDQGRANLFATAHCDGLLSHRQELGCNDADWTCNPPKMTFGSDKNNRLQGLGKAAPLTTRMGTKTENCTISVITTRTNCDVNPSKLFIAEISSDQIDLTPQTTKRICKQENVFKRAWNESLSEMASLLDSEIVRLKRLPQCGGAGEKFLHMGRISELPQWLKLNSGAPYEMLSNQLNAEIEKITQQWQTEATLQKNESQNNESQNHTLTTVTSTLTTVTPHLSYYSYYYTSPSSMDLRIASMTNTMKNNMEYMKWDILNLSKRTIDIFEAVQRQTNVEDMDGPWWDVGYEYAYDVNPPQSLVLASALERLQQSRGRGVRAWFLSDPGITEEGIRGQFTCIGGAQTARSLNYDEVLVLSLYVEDTRRLLTYMAYFQMPDALVLCGGVTFTTVVIMMLDSFNKIPKSIIVTSREIGNVVSALGGSKVNYVLEPLPFPIFNPSLESYLWAYQDYRLKKYRELYSNFNKLNCDQYNVRNATSAQDCRHINSSVLDSADYVYLRQRPYVQYHTNHRRRTFGRNGDYSLVSHQISAAASLVAYAAVTKGGNLATSGAILQREDFKQAFCFASSDSGGNLRMELKTEMGTIKFDCSDGRKPGKRVRLAEEVPQHTMSSSRQLKPNQKQRNSTRRYLSSKALIVADKDTRNCGDNTCSDVAGWVTNPQGLPFEVGRDRGLASPKHSHALTHPMPGWLTKEQEVYPCRPGCYLSLVEARCKACPPGTYRSGVAVCEYCQSSPLSYSDAWASPRCLDIPVGAIFVGINETPLAEVGYYQLHNDPCTADYKSKSGALTRLGDPNCCNQRSVVTKEALVCPSRRPYCVNFKGGTEYGTCKNVPAGDDPSIGLTMQKICDIDTVDPDFFEQGDKYSDPAPCTYTDGTAASLFYPCKCGTKVCKRATDLTRPTCYSAISLCMETVHEAIFEECNPGLCLGENRCREGNAGTLCLSCEEGYENDGMQAILAGKACQKCASKLAFFPKLLLLLMFWACCIWFLSFLFRSDAVTIVCVRGPVVRILISYFQFLGINSEMIELNYKDVHFSTAGGTGVTFFFQFLFLKPFDLITIDCITGQTVTAEEAPHLDKISLSITSVIIVFCGGICCIGLSNAVMLFIEFAQPIVKVWGGVFGWRAPLYFIFQCFPRKYDDVSGQKQVKTRTSRRLTHKFEPHGLQSHAVADDEHYFEAEAGHRYAKALLLNELRIRQSDATRQLIAWALIMYPVVGRIIVQLVRCHRDKFMRPRLMRSLEVICGSGAHMNYIPFGVGVGSLWFLTIPIIFLYLAPSDRDVNAHTVKKRASYGIILQGYRPHASWWQAFSVSRLGILLAVSCFGYSYTRAVVGMLVLGVFVGMHVYYQPFVPCERFGLWYLELYMLLAVVVNFMVSLLDMYIEYLGAYTTRAENFHNAMMESIRSALVALELVLAALTVIYGFWLLLVSTIDPHVKVHKEHHGKRNISLFYRLYGRLVQSTRGMSAIIVGWHRAGDKYIDVTKLTYGERRFLIFNLKETLQACFKANPYFAPSLLSVAFHEAFRRALVGRQAKRDAVRMYTPLRKRTRETMSSYVTGENNIRNRLAALHSRIHNVHLALVSLHAKERSFTNTLSGDYSLENAMKAQIEIQRQEVILAELEQKLKALTDAENVRHDFVVEYSTDVLTTFNNELNKLLHGLKSKGVSRSEVENGITVTDCTGHEITSELRFVDKARFPIRARFDTSKQVTVEELSAALADVNMDISSHHPEFGKFFPHPKDKRRRIDDEIVVPQLEPKSSGLARFCPKRVQRLFHVKKQRRLQAKPTKEKSDGCGHGLDAVISTVESTSRSKSVEKEKRDQEWKKCEEEWWARNRPKEKDGQDEHNKPLFLQSKKPESIGDAWDSAAGSLMDGMRMEEETRKEAESLNVLKMKVKAQQAYYQSLYTKLLSLGVHPINGSASDDFAPLAGEESEKDHKGQLRVQAFTDTLTKRPAHMPNTFHINLRQTDAVAPANNAALHVSSSPLQPVGDDPALAPTGVEDSYQEEQRPMVHVDSIAAPLDILPGGLLAAADAAKASGSMLHHTSAEDSHQEQHRRMATFDSPSAPLDSLQGRLTTDTTEAAGAIALLPNTEDGTVQTDNLATEQVPPNGYSDDHAEHKEHTGDEDSEWSMPSGG